jgi:hypothetical protein
LIRFGEDEIHWEEYGRADRLKRLGEPPAAPDLSVLGAYEVPDVKACAQVTDEDGEIRLHITGPFGQARYKLTQLAADLWSALSLGPFPVTMPLARRGRDLFFTTDRTSALPIRRVE